MGTSTRTLGQKLREVRKAAGLTQSQVSITAGVSLVSYVHYEHDRRCPPFSAMVKIVRVLGVDLNTFADCTFEAPREESGEGNL